MPALSMPCFKRAEVCCVQSTNMDTLLLTYVLYCMYVLYAGSFTHVIKAAEPVVSVLLSLVVLGAVPKPLTAISLLPITYGVAYASTLGDLNPATMAKELTTKAAQYKTFYTLFINIGGKMNIF